jgi:hypothetical protein
MDNNSCQRTGESYLNSYVLGEDQIPKNMDDFLMWLKENNIFFPVLRVDVNKPFLSVFTRPSYPNDFMDGIYILTKEE